MKQIIILPFLLLIITPISAYALTPYQFGYFGGIADGKADARDSGDVCESYTSTADSNACLAGYNLGFPKVALE